MQHSKMRMQRVKFNKRVSNPSQLFPPLPLHSPKKSKQRGLQLLKKYKVFVRTNKLFSFDDETEQKAPKNQI